MSAATKHVTIRRAAFLALLAAGSMIATSREARAQGTPAGATVTTAALPDDALGRAMRDELARSMKDLRLAALERPYFISYRVDEVDAVNALAARGALVSSNASRARYLTVELRVGDYAMDNTGFVGGGGMMMFGDGGSFMTEGTGELPLDDDYLAIRRALWLATDAAYKDALESIGARRANAVNRVRTDSLPDFWRDSATQTIDDAPAWTLARADAESMVRALSGTRELARLDRAGVHMRAVRARVRYVNSEGSTFIATRPLVELAADGATQAADGLTVGGGISTLVRSPSALPAPDALASRVRALAARIDTLRRAPVVDRYTGPVLVEGPAAAQLFADVFAPVLVGHRGTRSDVPGLADMMERDQEHEEHGDTLPTRPGSRVLPAGVSVVDDPTLDMLGKEPLLGGYLVDDEAVRARRTTLVEDGFMRAQLTTRTPVAGATHSTGNRRGQEAEPSNLLVDARAGVDDAELRRQLLAAVRKRGLPWGLIVREADGSASADEDEDGGPMVFFIGMTRRGGRRATLVYRVYPDGREELVRPMSINRLTTSSFRDIAALSRTPTVVHRSVGFGFGEGMAALLSAVRGGGASMYASYAVPSLLFDELSLGKVAGEPQNPPIIPRPSDTRE